MYPTVQNCTYIKYFTYNDERDGIPQTEAILREYITVQVLGT